MEKEKVQLKEDGWIDGCQVCSPPLTQSSTPAHLFSSLEFIWPPGVLGYISTSFLIIPFETNNNQNKKNMSLWHMAVLKKDKKLLSRGNLFFSFNDDINIDSECKTR